MSQLTNVCIGIQARSTSERLPNKAFEMIGDRPMLQHVIDACNRSALYMNRHSHKTGVRVDVAVLTPEGDPIVAAFRRTTLVLEGSEQNVLSRYLGLASQMKADYIVRVTGDCPLIPPYLITKHIKTAIVNRYDYVSNVVPAIRTAVDGHDCEVFSRKLLEHVAATETDAYVLEHVTPSMRNNPPEWAYTGSFVGFLALAGIKLSVDTPEDLENTRAQYDAIQHIVTEAEAIYGKAHVHRL